MTSGIIEWIPVFTNKEYFDIIIQSLKYCIQNKELALYNYVILDNHFHVIASAPELSNTMSSMKKYTAAQIIRQLSEDGKEWILNQFAFYKKKYKTKSEYQIWQEGLHPEIIQNKRMYTQKAEYIHHNPVKRGYVSQPEHWLYSSARNYLLGEESIIEVKHDLII
jgi:putative transposase